MNRLLYLLTFLACQACVPAEDPYEWAEKGLGDWLDYYELDFESFEKAHRFEKPYEVTYDYDGTKDDLYSDFYIYNADSTKAIDLDSYHLHIAKKDDGTYYSKGREPDMEVGLIDFANKIKRRVLFCGTPCIFEEAAFDPEENIVIAGHVENDSGYKPVLWIMSTKESFFEQHEYAADRQLVHLPREIRYISDIRLSEVTFWHEEEEPYRNLDVPL